MNSLLGPCAGLGLETILPAVIERISPPPGKTAGPLRMLLFDAFHDEYRGVICLVEIVDGHLRKGDKVVASSTGDTYDILEVIYYCFQELSWCNAHHPLLNP